jgi:hypothetical protein
MPTVVKTKKGPAAKKANTVKKTTAKAKTPAKASTNGRRTAEDVDRLVPQFVKHLKAGGTMRALKEEHGFSDDGPIRQALARKGYDSKGNSLELPTVKNTPASVASARKAGHAWYLIALALDKPESEVKAMAEKAGADTSGRVYVGGGRGR